MSDRHVYSAFDLPPRVETCAGNRYEPIYTLAYDDNDVPFLKQTGKKDLVLEMESQVEACSISARYARYLAGDENAFVSSASNFFYGDVSGIHSLDELSDYAADVAEKVENIRKKYEAAQAAQAAQNTEPAAAQIEVDGNA